MTQNPDNLNPNDGNGGAAVDPTLDADLRKLQEERDALFEQVARVQADFRNAQKRLESEKQQAVQFANSRLITSLLPVIDNFERALEQDPSKVDAVTIMKGMQIVHDQWIAVLRQQNVEEIAPQPGEAFDPNQHEALMQQDAPPEFAGKGPTVVQMLQKGYRLRDRTIRPAQVAVSKSQ